MHSVSTFYRFAPLADPHAARDRLEERLTALSLRGSAILASEGVNGTLSGPEAALKEGLDAIAAIVGPLRIGFSTAATLPFRRLRVKVKAEIVTMGEPDADPGRAVGRHVAPGEWNALLTDPDVTVIDTRNAYEVAIGSFAGAIDPGIATFRDFPAWWRAQAPALAGRKVAMFCTGGIRCEKATSLALQNGATEVFHLDGGILRYLAEVPEAESLWRGECFVFDERVALRHGLAVGESRICDGCGHPVAGAAACSRCAGRDGEG